MPTNICECLGYSIMVCFQRVVGLFQKKPITVISFTLPPNDNINLAVRKTREANVYRVFGQGPPRSEKDIIKDSQPYLALLWLREHMYREDVRVTMVDGVLYIGPYVIKEYQTY